MSKKASAGSEPAGHHDLIPLGPELDHLPHDTFERVLALISGGGVEEEDYHRLYHVLGFVLKKFHQHGPIGALMGTAPPMTADQLAAEMKANEEYLTTPPKVGAAAGAPPAWLLALAKFAAEFLLKLLG